MNQAERHLDHTRSPEMSEPDDKVSVETLTLGHDPTAAPQHWPRWPLATVTALATIAALAMLGTPDHLEPGIVGALTAPLNILVVGDASAGIEGCRSCLPYGVQFAAAMAEGGRRRTRIDDKTQSVQASPPSMPALVEDLRSNPALRSSVEKTDLILLAISSGDVTPCTKSRPTPCPAKPIRQFRKSLTDWIAETDTLRHHRPVELRVITPPPTSGLPRQVDVARTACEIAAAHRAACVNVYDLARTDEHVVAARADPSHPELTQHGHDLVAAKLITFGTT